MDTPEELRQRIYHEQRLIARLRLATTRLADAQQERLWAMVAAQPAGLSIRQIAAATGLSASRVHQLLRADEAQDIPVWLSRLREQELSAAASPAAAQPSPQRPMQRRLAEEVEVLRRCLDWLARLERGEEVIVNLRAEEETETEFVRFDRPRVLRVLARMAADLDELTRHPMEAADETGGQEDIPRARHRQRLAEPDPPPTPLSQRAQRAALRRALGLPPYDGR